MTSGKWVKLFMLVALFGQQQMVFADKTQDIVESFMQKQQLKSVVYGVWLNGRKITTHALGNSMTGVPATTDMHFRVGGVTEMFLTTLLMQLVEQDKLKLSDNVAKWFPKLPNAKLVTLKMLANSTSGYPDYVYNKQFVTDVTKHPFKHWTAKELLSMAFTKPMVFKPGTSQKYSHTNYVVLGDIIEKASNQSLDGLLDKNIFKPLSLTNTEFNQTAQILPPVLHAFSTDRGIYEDSTFWDPSWTSFSGLITANIEDLGTWANAFGTGKLISKESLATLMAPDTVGIGKNKAELYFAMGFGVMNHWLVQNPRFGGYSGVFGYLPQKNMAIIVFNTLGPKNTTEKNYSMAIFRQLVKQLTPEYQIPGLS